MPSYQKAAVETYLTDYPPQYPPDIWNSTGRSRAFPDLAANGYVHSAIVIWLVSLSQGPGLVLDIQQLICIPNSANYVVAIQGEFYLVYGTSCSSPVTASIFSAVNDARLAAGKSPVGFINPTV